MDKKKKPKNLRVKIADAVDIFPTESMTDTQDSRKVLDIQDYKIMPDIQYDEGMIEAARALVEETIAAAVQFVEDAKQPIKNVEWITHGEFTVEKGRRNIEKFVNSWEYESCWVHYTAFIEREDIIHSFRYIYCVRWSTPTALRPMPRGSFASAFFTIKINKNKPPDAPIDVSYIFEGQSLVQRPGMLRFREQWLRSITEAKHVLMESLPI